MPAGISTAPPLHFLQSPINWGPKKKRRLTQYLLEFSEEDCRIVLLNYKCLVKLQMIKVFAAFNLLNKDILLKSVPNKLGTSVAQ